MATSWLPQNPSAPRWPPAAHGGDADLILANLRLGLTLVGRARKPEHSASAVRACNTARRLLNEAESLSEQVALTEAASARVRRGITDLADALRSVEPH
jgi:hypothetical protein